MRHTTSTSGWYEHHVPVRTEFVRCRPSSGCTCASRRIAALIRYVTAVRARSELEPVDRGALPEPERVAQLGDERIELDLGAIGARSVVRLPRRVDVLLQVDDAFLVRAAGGLVERRAGRGAHVAGAHQLERVDLDTGLAEQDGEITDPLDVANRRRPAVERDPPCVALGARARPARWMAARRSRRRGSEPSRRARRGPGPRPRPDVVAGRRRQRDRSTASSSGNSSGSTVIAVDGGAAANRVAATSGSPTRSATDAAVRSTIASSPTAPSLAAWSTASRQHGAARGQPPGPSAVTAARNRNVAASHQG